MKELFYRRKDTIFGTANNVKFKTVVCKSNNAAKKLSRQLQIENGGLGRGLLISL